MKVWSRCDRCDFKTYTHKLHRESTGMLACGACFDGAFDIKRHPQNRSPYPRFESRKVPDGRNQQDLDIYIGMEDNEYLLQEDGGELIWTNSVWSPTLTNPT